MATRFRLPSSGSVTVTPSIQSYTHTGSTRAPLSTADSSTLTTVTLTPDLFTAHLVAGDTFFSQFVSDGMAGGITFTTGDAIACAIQGLELDNADNLFLQIYAAIVNNDGTAVQVVLLAKTADNTEYSATLTSRSFTSTQSGTTYTTVAGDRLVVEVSVSGTPTSAGGHDASLRFGSSGSGGDLLGNDTDTGTTLNPWIDFAPTITFQSGTPFIPVEWPTARITYHPTSLRTQFNGPLGGTTLPTFPGPTPVVRRASYPVSLRTSTNATRFMYVDPGFGMTGGFPQYDWPTVPRAHYPVALRTSTLNLSQTTLAPAGSIAAPFLPMDLPIVRPKVYASVLRTQFNGPLGPDVVPATAPPVQTEAFTRIASRVYPASLRTSAWFYVPDTTPHFPFVQTETRLVARAHYPVDLRTSLNGFRDILADRAFGLTVPAFDWPTPKHPTFPASLRTFTNATRFQYIDTLLRDPGQVLAYDWPNPKTPTYPQPLRSAFAALATLYSVIAPAPFAQLDWPNPKRASRPTNQRTALGWMPLMLNGQDTFYGGPGEPPQAQMWPNPRGPIYPSMLRTAISRFANVTRTFNPQWASHANQSHTPGNTSD